MRLGIIGAGAVAQLHAIGAETLPGVELSAVCDLRYEAAEAVAEPYGARIFSDYRVMFSSGIIDAVVINTPHNLHKQMVLDAAAAGIHVLVEKPMATSLADCDLMEQACEQASVKLVVGHIQHFMAEKLVALAAIESGSLGKVQMIHDYRSTDYRPGTRSQWFFDKEIAGGGALINIGAHCLDRCLWLGGADAADIRATTLNRFGVKVETDGAMELTLTNGVPVRIFVASDAPRHLDEILIVCEKGTLTIDPRTGTFQEIDGVLTQLHVSSGQDIQNAFTAQLADFLQCVAGGAPAVDVGHARHVVELVLAAYDSSASGRTVDFQRVGQI